MSRFVVAGACSNLSLPGLHCCMTVEVFQEHQNSTISRLRIEMVIPETRLRMRFSTFAGRDPLKSWRST